MHPNRDLNLAPRFAGYNDDIDDSAPTPTAEAHSEAPALPKKSIAETPIDEIVVGAYLSQINNYNNLSYLVFT